MRCKDLFQRSLAACLIRQMAFCIFATTAFIHVYASDFLYGFEDNKLVITSYVGAGGDVVIPATVAGEPIWGIAQEAFLNNSTITKITLSKGILALAEAAFFGCQKLTEVNIPEGLSAIGFEAFGGCPKLSALHVAAENTSFESIDGVLFDKSGETLLECPAGKSGSYAVPSGVKTIGYYAFAGCWWLTNVTLPEGLLSLKFEAFRTVTLSGLTIPSTVAEITPNALAGVTQNIEVNAGNSNYRSVDGVLFSKDGSTLIRLPSGRSGVYAIPRGVTTIEALAFGECANLTKVVVPDGVKTIKTSAFFYCTQLSAISLPTSIETVLGEVFYGDAKLRSIVFPGNQPFISNDAFDGINLKIYYLEGSTTWSSVVGGAPTALWNAKVEAADVTWFEQDGVVAFVIKGTPDIEVAIEASDDLKTWTEVGSKKLTGGSARYIDFNAFSHPHAAFRLRIP